MSLAAAIAPDGDHEQFVICNPQFSTHHRPISRRRGHAVGNDVHATAHLPERLAQVDFHGGRYSGNFLALPERPTQRYSTPQVSRLLAIAMHGDNMRKAREARRGSSVDRHDPHVAVRDTDALLGQDVADLE